MVTLHYMWHGMFAINGVIYTFEQLANVGTVTTILGLCMVYVYGTNLNC